MKVSADGAVDPVVFVNAASAVSAVILSVAKDLRGTYDNILHYIQDDNTFGVEFKKVSSFFVPAHQ